MRLMGDRAIIHIDINHCFAQIEEMKYPELKHVPMCVGGKEETRNGIVLARNLKAKAYGIKTAESLRDAYRKCPELLVINPSYDDYQYYSDLIKDVYREYTDDVESFGIDEAWLDVSASQRLFGTAPKIGKEIQERVLNEFGITVSVGVSFNKIFSKLGSDMTKPSGFHVITKDNYKEVIWDLPASELLYVGPKTYPKLQKLGIDTIGELAQFDVNILKKQLGKHGELIWAFANGLDESDVDNTTPLPKSIGNGITTPRNIETFLELKQVLYVLIESVASRMKDKNLEGNTISITLRDTDLMSMSRHLTVDYPTDLVSDIMNHALKILKEKFEFRPPYRSITITVSNLKMKADGYQIDLFDDPLRKHKDYTLDKTLSKLREKHGFTIIKRASMLLNEELTNFDPKGSHTIYPRGFFK